MKPQTLLTSQDQFDDLNALVDKVRAGTSRFTAPVTHVNNLLRDHANMYRRLKELGELE